MELSELKIKELVFDKNREITAQELLDNNPGALIEAFINDESVAEITVIRSGTGFIPVHYTKMNGFAATQRIALRQYA